jgi:hypothetical protein
MLQNRTFWRCPRLLPALFGIAGALLSSSCMWGVVRDARTGAPIAGAEVHFIDSEFNSREAFTDANGVYRFLPASEPGPVAGIVNVVVSAPGYEALGDTRTVDFADGPSACLVDLPNSCEVQSFAIEPRPGTYRNVARGFLMDFPNEWQIWPSEVVDADRGLWDVWMLGDLSEHSSVTCGAASHELPAGEDPMTWWSRKSDLTGGRTTATSLGGVPAIRITYPGGRDSGTTFVDLAERSGRVWVLACFGDFAHARSDESVFEGLEHSFHFEQ